MSKYIKLEDAISEADRLLGMVLGTDFNEGVEHGILTIKFALLDIPTIEVSEDCISREYLLSKVYDMDNDNLVVDYKDIKDAPSVVPSTEQSSMVGEWIKQGISPYEGIQRCCFYNITEDFNFCPNCGADMRGGDNE